jgi:hypothetical protein
VHGARVAAHDRIEGVSVAAPVRPLVEEADGNEVVVGHLVRVRVRVRARLRLRLRVEVVVGQ